MRIRIVTENKKVYLPLLFQADESERMIDLYLDRGTLFALQSEGGETVGVCVVTVENEETIEIKNLAIAPNFQKQGWARFLIDHVKNTFKGRYKVLLVGTGDSPATLPFYEKCGFKVSHRIRNFFTDNYEDPIIEDGVQLIDMVVLKWMI